MRRIRHLNNLRQVMKPEKGYRPSTAGQRETLYMLLLVLPVSPLSYFLRISVLGHINRYGKYHFETGPELELQPHRPLRQPSVLKA